MLVIDDAPAVRELIGRCLSREGFRVAVAVGGKGRLRLAREFGPDAIALALMMPGVSPLKPTCLTWQLASASVIA